MAYYKRNFPLKRVRDIKYLHIYILQVEVKIRIFETVARPSINYGHSIIIKILHTIVPSSCLCIECKISIDTVLLLKTFICTLMNECYQSLSSLEVGKYTTTYMFQVPE